MDGPEIVLSKSSDWDLWLFDIKIRATGLGVWDLIDPAKDTKPQGIIEPNRPESLHPNQVDLKDNSEYQRDLLNLKIYRLDLEEYRRQQQNLSTISLYIMRTVAPELLSRLAHLVSDHHPWEMMRILANRLAPTPIERVIDADVARRSLEASRFKMRTFFNATKDMNILHDVFDKREMAMAQARKIAATIDGLQVEYALEFSSSADEDWFEKILYETTKSEFDSIDVTILDRCRRRVKDLGSVYKYQPSDRPDTPDWDYLSGAFLSDLIDGDYSMASLPPASRWNGRRPGAERRRAE